MNGWMNARRYVLLAAIALLTCGCGSLNRSIPFAPLSIEDMQYADAMPDNHATYVVPTFPVIWGKAFVHHTAGFEVSRNINVLLIAASDRHMFFDRLGQPAVDITTTNVLLLGGIDSVTDLRTEDGAKGQWRVRLLSVPILSRIVGPCFGFGSGYAKFLWIPFANEWPT